MFLLADRQDLTRLGIAYLIERHYPQAAWQYVEDKVSLLQHMGLCDGDAVVVIDFNLFDINGSEEMLLLADRFPKARWIIFSEDISVSMMRVMLSESQAVSFCFKDSLMSEAVDALRYAVGRRRFLCQHAMQMLLSQPDEKPVTPLTNAECDILRDIALGMTTKEIAQKRVSSFHTVNTHRKNIFRKLNVNNAYEAVRYALRAGIVDAAEYYI